VFEDVGGVDGQVDAADWDLYLRIVTLFPVRHTARLSPSTVAVETNMSGDE
jgi:hypothetical protein